MTKTSPPLAPRPSRRRRIFGVLAGLVLFAIVFLVLFPGSWLRAIVNDKGSSKLGREFAIDGPLTVRWHRYGPDIHVEKLRLANEKGLKEPNMVEIGRIDASVNIWPIFKGQLNLRELKLTDLKIILEKTSDDDKNWKFPALSQGKAVANAALPRDRHDFPVIGTLAIENGMLEYRDDPKKLDLKLTIDTVTGAGGKGDSGLKVAGDGLLQDKNFKLTATGGSIDMLRDTSKPYPLDLSVEMGATKIAVKGTFTDPVKVTGMDARLSLKGDNLADLFYLTAIPLPPTPPYAIEGQLIKKEDTWQFNQFKGVVGKSDLGGDLKYETADKRGKVTAQLNSRRLDIDELRGFTGAPPKLEDAGATQKDKAAAAAASPNLFPDVPIKLNRLRATDMDVTLKAGQVAAPGWPLEDMFAHVDLKDGLLRIDPLRFGLAGGALQGSLVLDGREDVPKVEATISLERLSLKKFMTSPKLASMSKGTFGGHIQLAGTGDSLAKVAGDSNGRVTMLMSGGEISLLLIKAAGLDVANAGAIFASGNNEATPIRCGIGDFNVKDGLLTSDILVFDTGDTSFTGGGTINLKTQTIDAGIEASPKSPTLLAVGTPIRVTGLLKKPAIGLDPKEAGARVGAAAVLGTLLTPLAAIVPFIELGLGKDSDCRGLIAQVHAHDRTEPSADRTGQAPVTTAP